MRELARGAALEPVCVNELGGVTFRDIAVAAMSTEWNYGAGWQDALVAAYGIEPDPERLAYSQALWNAT